LESSAPTRAPTAWAGIAERLGSGRLVQFISDQVYGDAASTDLMQWHRTFREAGIDSPVHAHRFDAHHADACAPLERYQARDGDVRLFHYTTWTPAAEFVLGLGRPLVLMYHNVTPPSFFAGLDPETERATARGRADLGRFAPITALATPNSEYSRADLVAAGFDRTVVLPLRLDFLALERECDEALRARVAAEPSLLVVGRVVPNKRIEDVIRALAHYRRIEPRARLYCVGAHDERGAYQAGLKWLIHRLGLDDAVEFTGQVPTAARGAYYRGCRALVTMSEHEGFCAPVVEAMHLGLPVVGFAATATPETMGDAGVLVLRKHPGIVAEALDQLVRDTLLRRRLVEKGRARAATFAPGVIEATFAAALGEVLDG
jgi:glycosyltransferase involved in cell wall biosynthesis